MAINFNKIKKVGDYTSGHVGSVADGAPKYARTYSVELSASQDATAGAPLLLGTDPGAQARPTRLGDVVHYHNFAGFMLLDPTKEASDSGPQYSNGDEVAVLKLGVLNVKAGANVTAGQAVVVQVNGGGLRGAHATGSLAAGEFFLPTCRWLDSVSSGGTGQVSIGFELAHREISGSL
jgi:hypothetical protein